MSITRTSRDDFPVAAAFAERHLMMSAQVRELLDYIDVLRGERNEWQARAQGHWPPAPPPAPRTCWDMHDGVCTTARLNAMYAEQGITFRYYVDDVEVTKDEWVAAERTAGFHNTLGHPDEPGTDGWSTNDHRGRIEQVQT